MTDEWVKFDLPGDEHARLGLMRRPGTFGSGEGDLGQGTSDSTYYFLSAEGREYFIQARRWEDIANRNAWDFQSLRSFMESLISRTGRIKPGAAKRIIERLNPSNVAQLSPKGPQGNE